MAKQFVQGVTLGLIKLYQRFFSPFFFVGFGIQCRFTEESCSSYAARMVSEGGVFHAAPKIFFRLLCCNPFSLKQAKIKRALFNLKVIR